MVRSGSLLPDFAWRDEVPVSVEELRAQARAWLASNAALRATQSRGGDGSDGDGSDDDQATASLEPSGDDQVARAKACQAALYDAGFVGVTWPTEYGGRGLTKDHQQAFADEAAGYELPVSMYTIGLGMVAPTILEFGTEQQKKRHIRPMLRGEEVWSQLFSEPGAGSDVASLQTRAVRDGDEWVLNGQKVWTTGAQHSDYGAVIARTNPDQPKHRGITMFIVNLRGPGVTVKPLREITGGAAFNEVFFDDVRVPTDAVIGQVDDGWRCAVAMLMNERVAIGASGGPGAGGGRRAGGFDALLRLTRDRGRSSDPVVRDRLAQVFIAERVLSYIGLRVRAATTAGRAPGPEGSIAKLVAARLARFSSDLGGDIAGASAVAWEPGDRRSESLAGAILGAPAARIAGGTDEVQRNIIGERVLALPKEPQVDRDVPFRELKVGTQRAQA
jgi:alkylation response protein AidB-like acyl-CoA dehydrogenase